IFTITAYGSGQGPVKALKRGASDDFPRTWNNEKLRIEIHRIIGRRRLAAENTAISRDLTRRSSSTTMAGKNEALLRVLYLVGHVGASRGSIVITGETGTGRDVTAQAIHARSARAEQPFVPVHSGSVPPDLLESALFGHVKGAYSGATAARKGYFEVADR